MALQLSLACNDYEWLEPLIYGRVEADGIELDVTTDMPGNQRHDRTTAGEFDVAEFSLAKHILGYPDWEVTAIPVFPRRFCPHSHVFVHDGSGITEPGDFAGRRVALYQLQNTLAVWARGVFAEHHGLDLDAVEWVTSRPETFDVPAEPEIVDHESLPEQLARGDLDALVLPSTNRVYPLADGVRRLYGDPEPAERAYFEATGFYPVMHDVVIRDAVFSEHPWLPDALLDLFRRSHAAFADRITDESKYPLVWWQLYREREREAFGDVWGRSFDYDPNADELRTLIRYAHEQSLIEERFDPAELFV